VDIAGLPPKRLLHYFPDLEKKADRFIFGTDWPTIPSSIKQNISSIRQLPISESSKEKILRSNAQTLLNFRKEDSKKSEEVI
jgi:predicted TIM-barrel fold metal-dependent hydrolase